MDDARKLLDSLMGQTRDQDLNEARKKAGKRFMEENVCKFYLLGFCPKHDLQGGKLSAKRNIGDCPKIHSDALRAEYEAHAEKAKFQAEYEKELLPFLERCMRDADAMVTKERQHLQRLEQEKKDKSGPKRPLPGVVRDELAQLNQDIEKMMAAAEKSAEQGDIEGSKFKVTLAEEIKAKVKEIEERHEIKSRPREEEVCAVCGTRTECITTTNAQRYAAHFQGRVHLAYIKIRKWVEELRKKHSRGWVRREAEQPRENGRSHAEKKKRSGSPSPPAKRRSRSRSRSKSKSKAKKRSGSTSSRQKSKKSRSKSRNKKNRSRSRSRSGSSPKARKSRSRSAKKRSRSPAAKKSRSRSAKKRSRSPAAKKSRSRSAKKSRSRSAKKRSRSSRRRSRSGGREKKKSRSRGKDRKRKRSGSRGRKK